MTRRRRWKLSDDVIEYSGVYPDASSYAWSSSTHSDRVYERERDKPKIIRSLIIDGGGLVDYDPERSILNGFSFFSALLLVDQKRAAC